MHFSLHCMKRSIICLNGTVCVLLYWMVLFWARKFGCNQNMQKKAISCSFLQYLTPSRIYFWSKTFLSFQVNFKWWSTNKETDFGFLLHLFNAIIVNAFDSFHIFLLKKFYMNPLFCYFCETFSDFF